MIIFFIIICAAFLLFGKTLFLSTDKIIYGGDLLTQFYFWKGYLVQSFRSGIIPFWNPYLFSGTPFLAHPSTAFFYPFNFIFILFPLNTAFSIYLFIHFIIAGIGMYLLAKSYTSSVVSLGTALVYILGGYFASRIYAGHIDIFSTSVWIPWVFWSSRNLHNRINARNILWFISLLSFEILSGYSAVVLFTAELIILFLLFQLFRTVRFKNRIDKKKYIYLFISSILAIGITSIQWLPVLEFVRLSIRGGGLPYSLASWGSIPISGLKLFLNPWDSTELVKLPYGFSGFILPNFFEYFTGKIVIISIFLFLIIVIVKKITKIKFSLLDYQINSDFWFYTLSIIFFIWVSLGIYAPINLHYILYKLIPFYRNIRIPAQHLIIVSFLLPLMFGMIINSIKNRILGLLIGLIVIISLFGYSRRFYILTDIPSNMRDIELRTSLKYIKSDNRLLPYFSVVSPILNYWDFNSPMKDKILTTAGYDPMILRNFYNFMDIINKNNSSSLIYHNVEVPVPDADSSYIDFLGVNYLLIDADKYLNTDKWNKIAGNDKFRLLINKSNNVRFRFVPIAEIYDNEVSLKDYLLKGNADFSNKIYVTKEEAQKIPQKTVFNCNKNDIVQIREIIYNTDRIKLYVDSPCNGFISTAEVYYPGWRAKVDNIEVPVLQSNYAFRSILITTGKHNVEFYYSPDIYYKGGLISSFSIFALVILIKPNFIIRSLRKIPK